jgi:hypothetical protein
MYMGRGYGMLGEWSRSKTVRIALWATAFTVGALDVLLTHKWWHAGLYVLGAAMCATMRHQFMATVGAASVKAYLKGREHQDTTRDDAQVISIRRRR